MHRYAMFDQTGAPGAAIARDVILRSLSPSRPSLQATECSRTLIRGQDDLTPRPQI
ncbi:hypothetical protein BH10PSE13_BH10PSE13_01440 [soil metagenome]